ncbi:hypothetical protein ABZ318_33460 [Streptomyces sp. NPDC006197]|uniref:hypothetical protein n=1 Tax=Streptomyces sp. NPDC006197 TaxID=3156685 RepID=UPI0033A5EBBF
MTRVRRAIHVALSTTLMSAALVGCGILGVTGADMNMQEAADHSDAMLDKTIGTVVPEIQWTHDDTTVRSCDLTRRRTVMTIISEQRRGAFLGVVERFWKKSGYEITSVNHDKEMPAVFATSPDGFQLVLTFGYKGQAFFYVVTPCVDSSEVAAPKATPNGPAYEGVEIPTPNVRSDFWSATTPAPAPSA